MLNKNRNVSREVENKKLGFKNSFITIITITIVLLNTQFLWYVANLWHYKTLDLFHFEIFSHSNIFLIYIYKIFIYILS